MFDFNVETTKESSVFDETGLWDFLIIGSGPAGFNAALYAKRKGLSVGILTDEIGGQLHNTTTVDNYLGYSLIDGADLSAKFLDHINTLAIPILKNIRVTKLKKDNQDFELGISDGRTLKAKTVLIATGGLPRKLDIPGEEAYANRGVSYCATCDAPFYKDKHVIVAGGGNSAAEGVIDLAAWANKITVVHRSQWRADEILLEKLKDIPQLSVHLETEIKAVLGDKRMTGVAVYDKLKKKTYEIAAEGLLIEIGNVPNSNLVFGLAKTNDKGEIIVGANQMTSVAGLFAAGDVTTQPDKQIIISTAEGAKAALAANQYLNKTYKERR